MQNSLKHIAIILDGNRRWAKSKGMPAQFGHKEGAKVLENISKHANDIGIQYMTVYAFSTENWKRSKDEVEMLMSLFQNYLDEYSIKALDNNIKVKVIGTRKGLNEKLISSIENCEKMTSKCTGLNFNIALNYGSREEITQAVQNIAKQITENNLEIQQITEQTIQDNLYTSNIPDPDLVIRTSGEVRLSNFLMWQIAYAELLFVDKNWPEFTNHDLDMAIEEFNKRNRKFGGK